MTVSFPTLPQSLRIPLFFAEVDNSQANSAPQTQRTLVLGAKTADGTAVADVAAIVQGVGVSARSLFGRGSQLAGMVEWYRKRDRFGEVWGLPVADNAASVSAVGEVVLSSAATAPGTLSVSVAGERVQVRVAAGQAVAAVATALAAAVSASVTLPVTAVAVAGVVTLTARNAGASGNEISIIVNAGGSAAGEATPAGLGVAVVAMAGGTATPALDAALLSLGDRQFDFIASAFTDAASLASLRAFLAERWSWDKMLYGGVFAAKQGNLAALATFGAAQNDPHLSVLGFPSSATPSWAWAANYAGAAAVSLKSDPGLPLQTLALDVSAPALADRFVPSDRNALLYDGISTHTVDDSDTVRLETCITTYQRNAFGDADDSYLYVEKMYVLSYVIRHLRAKVQSVFGRQKLADDGTLFAPGSSIVTPKVIRAAIVAWYRDLEYQGLVQDSDVFAANLVVSRNAGNRCRVDGVLPVVPVDQLRQLCALVQFRNSVGQ